MIREDSMGGGVENQESATTEMIPFSNPVSQPLALVISRRCRSRSATEKVGCLLDFFQVRQYLTVDEHTIIFQRTNRLAG